MISVSPSQRPVETPFQLSGRSAGHFIPLSGTQWNQVFCSNRNASESGWWTMTSPCGELMFRDMPNGRQLAVYSPFLTGSYSFQCFNPHSV